MSNRGENDDTRYMMFDGLPAAIVICTLCYGGLYLLYWLANHG